MGCVASKLEEEEEVVSMCRERKKQLKLAVDKRYELAEAHCKYFHSLYAVAASIKLFVARHSSPSSPFLITFPPSSPSPPTPPPPSQNVITNPMFLQQTPSETKHVEAIAASPPCGPCNTSSCSEEEREDKVEEEEEAQCKREQVQDEQQQQQQEQEQEQQPCEYYYMHMPMPMSMPMAASMPSPQRDFGWDFFNPFDVMRTNEVISGYRGNSDDDLRVVREEEGIPELEEEVLEREEEEVVDVNKVVVNVFEEKKNKKKKKRNSAREEHVVSESVKGVDEGEQRGLAVLETEGEGRELLEALKDIEDHFVRAYDSGKDLTKMLEANRIPLHSSLDEIKESSTKLIQAITWKSMSSRPSSCKSLVVSDKKNSSTWVEYKNDLFDDYGGMDSGSHLLTLGRLYEWEKKLFEEVKAGDSIRKNYEKKCAQLRNKNVKGDDETSMDKTKAAAKDLYAGILVAIRRAESISKRIQKMRDEELQPQIVELLKGLTQSWKVMLESHETQKMILSEVKSFTCPTFGKFCNQSHRLATLQLETQLQNWRMCFREYTAAQKAYVEALHSWLSKFIVPEVEFYSRSKDVPMPYHQANGPPLLVICSNWLNSLQKLPDKMVSLALKSVAKDVRALWHQQGEELQQKRKVDSLAKDLERRSLSLHKDSKMKLLELQVMDPKPEAGSNHDQDQEESLMEKNDDQLETLRRKLEVEKEKHQSCMQETQRITLRGLQSGFSLVFESLTEFSKASQRMYNELVACSENGGKVGNIGYIEGDGCNAENCNKNGQ
ncbi:protein ALTERED PHOSPHATE STARVATION RESPONSE 1-like [Arachis duranensis]|uniref:Protein ALTERED PHOSPHATE STARVATION RESPONSE 1-like n=1 Tax=Arachis duranensis TaxID=130453 RepID=A0A6P4C716_ARADU|nr:protein ALTERED PHOSPHATE STARVATION RESPONSE 1-like [Arachis duranensis]